MTNDAIHILLVDDDSAHRKLACRALSEAFPKLRIHEAASNDQARELLRLTSFRAVILDLRLGADSGLVLLELLRKSHDRLTLPVLILSTSALEQDIQASYRLGANCYIVKSSDPEEYQTSLKKAVKFFLPFCTPIQKKRHDIPPATT